MVTRRAPAARRGSASEETRSIRPMVTRRAPAARHGSASEETRSIRPMVTRRAPAARHGSASGRTKVERVAGKPFASGTFTIERDAGGFAWWLYIDGRGLVARSWEIIDTEDDAVAAIRQLQGADLGHFIIELRDGQRFRTVR